MASPSSSMKPQDLKTYFKTPEGKYNLHHEKILPPNLLHYTTIKTVSQATIAFLKEKPQNQQPTTPTTPSSSSGVRSAAARLLGAGNGSRALSFVNGSSKVVSGSNKFNSIGASGSSSNFDGKGTYLVFNIGDTIFVSDLNSQEKEPIKAISFTSAVPIVHAFDADAKDGHDLIIGFQSGDVYTVSLRQQLQDVGKKLVGAQHYNKDGAINNSRCTCVAWVPEGDGAFIVAHADGNIYVYEKSKDATADCSFPAIKDQSQFSVAHSRSSKSNPIARWHICQGSVNGISFSTDGAYLATVSRDGYLRVFDFSKEQLVCGGKSYYGALLCCAWSPDGKYILTGGEDDLVQVWSMEERKIVAWGEGHSSWVSGVAFDSYWSAPNSDEIGDSVMYRFGSIGQDTQLLLWDLVMDEIAVPLRYPPGGSPTLSSGSHSAHWDNICPMGTLRPAPNLRDMPKLSPLVAQRVHVDPLSGIVFTSEYVLTSCREGHTQVWSRPVHDNENSQSNNPETVVGCSTSLKDRPNIPSIRAGSSSYKQPPPILLHD